MIGMTENGVPNMDVSNISEENILYSFDLSSNTVLASDMMDFIKANDMKHAIVLGKLVLTDGVAYQHVLNAFYNRIMHGV